MLRQVKLSMQLQALRSKLDNQEAARQALAERRAAMAKREAELEEALKEVTEQTSEEDKALLDEAVSQHEADSATLAQEEKQDAETRADLQKQIDTSRSWRKLKSALPRKRLWKCMRRKEQTLCPRLKIAGAFSA